MAITFPILTATKMGVLISTIPIIPSRSPLTAIFKAATSGARPVRVVGIAALDKSPKESSVSVTPSILTVRQFVNKGSGTRPDAAETCVSAILPISTGALEALEMRPMVRALLRLVFLSLLAASMSGGQLLGEVPKVERHLVLRDGSGMALAECIESSRHDDNGDLTAWAVVTPERHRAIWTSQHVAADTSFSGKLEDLESGWWAELKIATGQESPRYSTEGASGLIADLREQQPVLTVTIETSEGFYVERKSRFGAAEGDQPDWREVFATRLAEEEIGTSLPQSVKEEIRFLNNVGEHLAADGTFAAELVELLHGEITRAAEADKTAESDAYSELNWEIGHGTRTVGDEEDPRSTSRELADQFKKSEPAESDRPDS